MNKTPDAKLKANKKHNQKNRRNINLSIDTKLELEEVKQELNAKSCDETIKKLISFYSDKPWY